VLYSAHDGAARYCKFATLGSFISGYWRFLERAPYSGWEEHADDAQAFIRFIGPIYTPTAGYANKVLALLPEAQALLDGGAPPITGNTTLPSLGTVVIDPGHGGTSKVGGSSPNNAIAASGVKEKKLTLDVALMMAAHLQAQAAAKGRTVQVKLTRDADVNVGIAERAGLAKASGATRFVSLHFNGANGSARGTETFYAAAANGNLNEAADKAFAARIQAAALHGFAKAGITPKDRGVKPDNASGPGRIGVLSDQALGNAPGSTPCLACLVELEFIDNPAVDRAFVSGPTALQARGAVAEAMAAALLKELGG
jgi:N-acetylmuramoyl-L-alanine amidase